MNKKGDDNGLVCPKENREEIENNGRIRHLLLGMENILQIAGIKNPDSEERDILPEGYRCICGTIVGIKRSNGQAIPLCALETQ